MPKPRVLFLAESFWPVLGGGERHIDQLAQALVVRGHACTVVTRRSDPGWPAEEVRAGVRILRVGPSGPARLGKYLMALPAAWCLWRERERYDLAVVRGTRVLGLPGLFAARLAGRAVALQPEISGEMSGAIYTWGTRFDRPPFTTVATALTRARNLLLRDASGFVTISRRTHEEFLAAGLAPERVHLIPHGVDLRRFRPAEASERAGLRLRLGLPTDARVIVFTGRLLRGKGAEVLLEAFEQLTATRPDTLLLFVGSGEGQALSIEAPLRAAVAQRGLEARIRFTGRVENVEDHLRAADIYGFPSFFEAMPLSVLEAAACGLPAATTRIGGITDVIEHERSGLLVEPGDALGLALALARLLDDEELRTRLGQAARQTVERAYDFDATVTRYADLFADLLGSAA